VNKISTVFFCLLLTACSVTQYKPDFDLRDQHVISNKVSIDYDQFTKQKSIRGPIIRTGNILNKKSWFLRSFKRDNSKTPTTQIYVSVYYYGSDWRFLERAATNGEFFKTTKISREVVSCSGGRCSYREDLAINITIEKLHSLLDDNGVVMFGIKDRYGENWVVDLTKEYIDAFASNL